MEYKGRGPEYFAVDLGPSPLPSPVSLEKQAVSVTQREERGGER
jgi:hypothetical protein